MTHLAHRMHDNSLSAYRAEEVKLSRRAHAIIEWIRLNGPRTDREIAYGMGFGENLNAVRPRITELLEDRLLMEVCTRTCSVTRKPVRVVDLRRPRQLEIAA